MNDNTTYYTDLITRYFSGEITEDELLLLSGWLKTNPANEELFGQYRKTWQLIEKQKIQSVINIDQEWASMQAKMDDFTEQNEKPVKIISLHPNSRSIKSSLSKVWQVAATVTVLLVSTFLLYFYFSKPTDIVITAHTANIDQVLPDGSVVSLQAGSQITYPAKFESKTRNVELKGEAYFKVAHDKTKPFIVASGDARVEVLGTEFNVNTNTSAGSMEVVLTTGKVSVYYKAKPQANVMLLPGEKAELLADKQQISKSANTDPNYMAWKTRILVFDNETLAQVASTLQNVYQTPVKLADPQLAECSVTASFNDQSIQSVIEVIAETLDLQVKHNGEIIELSGKGCK
jgi:transmembrane sensor